MSLECAFCGCRMFESRRVYCEDCRAEHAVCQTCAEDVAREHGDGYWLVA